MPHESIIITSKHIFILRGFFFFLLYHLLFCLPRSSSSSCVLRYAEPAGHLRQVRPELIFHLSREATERGSLVARFLVVGRLLW